jgi:hypothetical protein
VPKMGREESAQAAVPVRQIERLAALHEGVVQGRWVDSARQERIEVAVVEKRHQEDQTVATRLVGGRAEVGMGDGVEVRLVGMEERLEESLA